MIQFEWPWMLLALPLPWLVRRYLPAAKLADSAALRVPFLDTLKQCQDGSQQGRSKTRLLWLAALAWVLLVTASARPQWINEQLDIPVSGRDLMLAVDVSGSMRTLDFVLEDALMNRLQAVKRVAGDFIRQRRGDRLGLILFGQRPYLVTPLTFDIETVNTQLQEALIGIAGSSTAIGDAIVLAARALRKTPQQSRVLILLTDGKNTAGEISPARAAQLAASLQLKIYTIGIGADTLINTGAFINRMQKNTAIDEAMLTQLAQATGGQYFRAHDTEALQQIYRQIDRLEPIELDSGSYRPIQALFYWPLAAALSIALLVSVLRLWQHDD